jgi:hypothetical protein
MRIKLNLKKKVVDMENPKNNQNDEQDIVVDIDEPFERDFNLDVFKVIQAKHNMIILEYDRHYGVKNEHRGYEYNTPIEINETKEITSMWGKNQTTYKITYLGVEEKTLQEAIEEHPAEVFKEKKIVRDTIYSNLDEVIKDSEEVSE